MLPFTVAVMRQARLVGYQKKLADFGCESTKDFVEVRDRDFPRLKMPVLRERRFRTAFLAGGGLSELVLLSSAVKSPSSLDLSMNVAFASSAVNHFATETVV